MTARAAIAAMTAYTLELREAEIKLNQNESPFDFPLKAEVLARVAQRAWNRYPDFESSLLREALAKAYGYTPDNILVGNGSNDLLAAAIATFVGPGTPVVLARPTFALYEKLVTIAGGMPVPIDVDFASGELPLDEMTRARSAVVIVCSPNNPTGSVLPDGGIDQLLATGATVLFDRAYGDFALDELPPLHDRLVTFSTFSKAWGLAALRVGWLASTAATCREIRKVKLPYSLNIISETAAALALENRELRDANVARIIAERERMLAAMRAMPGVTVFPTRANFIAFRSAAAFEDFLERGILLRNYADFLRVSVGTREENDAFLDALSEGGRPVRLTAGGRDVRPPRSLA
ncbi:MAG TPA: aminotransferase class I/II-fold pyridoxal phosphate-dependent enzyme [Thermoanaerobaculia bacterium]|nr:aminotransferase class I/II-fold pyridoxal phosphate-dependent enzyme [Thermoanaerobaculia bacterium]